ncbi:MAG: cation efflux system protein [Pirellulaceae bacterium]|nr:MAG: cation efflux system protein [Pirellulaceae bacterium]
MKFPNLSALAVREGSVTLFFLLLSIGGGIYAFLSLGRAEDPAFKIRALVVSAIWPGATAEEMVEQVADRLEKRFQEVPYFYRVETTARPGRVDMVVEFQDYTPGEELPEVLYQVRKRMLDEAPLLPEGVIGPIVNDDFADVYFNLISITAPGVPMRELVRIAEQTRDRIARVPGVQKAVLIGERPERVYVDFDLSKLHSLGIPAPQVFQAIRAQNQLVPAGFLETAGPRIYFRSAADLADVERIKSIPLRIGERILPLSELAEVRMGYEEPPQYLVRAGGEDALMIGVVMADGENGLELGDRLQAFLVEEQARLPLGIFLNQFTNQADAISQAVDLFQIKFLVALGVVMLVTLLALGLRAGLIVGIAVPVTLGITFMIMSAVGINLDRITLGALIISLGLLVDDAMISIEMMIVKLEEGWDRLRAAAHAWQVTAAPMLFGTLVTVAGFVPIGFARSGVGEYAGNIFWVLMYSLLASWLVAVTFTPYLGVKLLPNYKKHGEGDDHLYQTRPYRLFRSFVRGGLRLRWLVILVTFGMLVAAIVGLAGPVKKQFFPASDRPEVLINVYMPQGTSIQATDAVVRKLESLVAKIPQFDRYASFVGAGAPRFFISLNPEQPSSAFGKIVAIAHNAHDRDIAINELRKAIAAGEFPEARIRVSRLLFGPAAAWPVGVRVIGPDADQLRKIALQVRDIMEANPHTENVNLDWNERAPVYQLKVDVDRLRAMGLTPLDVAQQAQFSFDGVPVTELRQDIRTVQLRARGRAGLKDLESWSSLEIKNQQGRTIPVAQLGELEVRFEEPVIKRYNREMMLAVQCDNIGAESPDVATEVWNDLAELRERLPIGYRLEQAGTVENSEKANASINKLGPVMFALMLVFIMLQVRTFNGAFTTLATAPLGVIGAVAALLLFNQPFGFVALLGLIGLAGILMRNTLILTQQVSDNYFAGMSPEDSIVEAVVRRARPVLLTASAAMLAFIPLTHDVFWGPMAYVLIGGVASGTVITLLAVPALYSRYFLARQRRPNVGEEAASV